MEYNSDREQLTREMAYDASVGQSPFQFIRRLLIIFLGVNLVSLFDTE
jgi:hypothetical protein